MTDRFTPPGHYDDRRRHVWTDTVDRLTEGGRIFTADPRVIDAYVQAAVTHDQAAQILAQTPPVVIREGPGGRQQAAANPTVAVQQRAARELTRLSRELGLHHALPADPMSTPPATETHESEELPGRWCDQHKRRECTHDRSKGRGVCHGIAVKGTPACGKHGGKTLAELKADGERRLARTYGQPRPVGAGEALMEEIARTAGAVDYLAELVAAIEPEALWWGRTKVTQTPDGALTTVEARAHVVLQAYWKERDHLADISSAALARGAEQQMVDWARLAGMGAAKVLDRVLDALQLSPEQRAQIPQVVPDAFRALEAGGSSS